MKLSLILLGLMAVAVTAAYLTRTDWRTASRESAGLAPDPAITKDAVVQIYAARAINWRGWFAVHCWIATKEQGASHYTTYQVVGYRLQRTGTSLVIEDDIPDRSWFGAKPYVIDTLTGDVAQAAIPKIKAAALAYPDAGTYHAWPGPNSNSFISYIIRNVPELGVELPPHAIGKDWGRHGILFGPSESGTGVQASLFGILGLTIGKSEGIEINLLGLSLGIDFMHPALKLPIIGRIGMIDRP